MPKSAPMYVMAGEALKRLNAAVKLKKNRTLKHSQRSLSVSCRSCTPNVAIAAIKRPLAIEAPYSRRTEVVSAGAPVVTILY